MQIRWWKAAGLSSAVLLAGCVSAFGQQLPLEPFHNAGQSITGALEGWFKNPDGSFSILLGYYNRNLKQEVDIPVGANNRIEPGGPDRGQPTHFMPGRMWGVFSIKVPKDFGTAKLTWSIVANGKTTTIPISLNSLWEVSPFIDAIDNTPPFLSFEPFDKGGPTVQGPLELAASLGTTLPNPVTLTAWVADDVVLSPGRQLPKTAPVSVTWSKYRGPGDVKFANNKPAVEKIEGMMPPKTKFAGKATTTATFSEPGEYILYLSVNDVSGDGGAGFQCCWTTGHVKVSVKAPTTSE